MEGSSTFQLSRCEPAARLRGSVQASRQASLGQLWANRLPTLAGAKRALSPCNSDRSHLFIFRMETITSPVKELLG